MRGNEFANIPSMATKFLAREDNTIAAITFSAIEAGNESANHLHARSPIFVRALVDGAPAEPGEVRITTTDLETGGNFTFVQKGLNKGIHTVQLQWRVDPDPNIEDDPIGLLRSGTIMVRTGVEGAEDETGTLAAESHHPVQPDEIDPPVDIVFVTEWQPVMGDNATAMNVSFYVPDEANIAVTFSAEVQATYFAALDLRARLEDGSMPFDIDEVRLAQGVSGQQEPWVMQSPVSDYASRSWTFTSRAGNGPDEIPPGWHRVSFEWRYRFAFHPFYESVQPDQHVRMWKRTVSVVTAPKEQAFSRLIILASNPQDDDVEAPVGIDEEDWETVPGLVADVEAPHNAQVAVTFNGEIEGTNLVNLRLLLNDEPVPDSELKLTQAEDAIGTFSHTYALKHLKEGTHEIGVQWLANGAFAEATMKARNLVIAVEELPVPDLGDGPDVGAAAGHGSVEHAIEPITGERRMLVVIVDPERPQVDEIILNGTDDGTYIVTIDGTDYIFEAQNNSETDIVYGLVNAINDGNQPVTAEPVNTTAGLAAFRIIANSLGANQFTVTVDAPGTPMNLSRCPQGASCHNAPVPNKNAIYDLAFGANQSAAHFWDVSSGGRLKIVPAGQGVYGPYTPGLTGTTAIDHFWKGLHNCDDLSVDNIYNSGHGERFYLGLAKADDAIDFSEFDINRDGVLQSDELVIVVATPQIGNSGSAYGTFKPFCNNSDVEFDGVIIPELLSWYTGNGNGAANVGDEVTLAHELGHAILRLDDMYTQLDHDGYFNSVMSATFSNAWQHLDGFQKLALGWVTPRIVRESGLYELEDVKTGREVLILPRMDSYGLEYFLIENRRETALGNNLYDSNIGDSGLAIWHVLEPWYDGVFGCASNEPAPPDCLPMSAWQCPPSSHFLDTSQNYIRRALRLIRPKISLFTDGSNALWDAVEDDVLETAPVCPDPQNNITGIGRLVWAYGTPSGYQIANISQAGATMEFYVILSE
jgi:M6 family metalloprotease-like protein